MGNPSNPLCPFCKTGSDCFRHKPKNQPKEKKIYKIPNKSDKQKEIDKELKKMYPVFLALPENKYCKLKLDGCLKVSNQVHHVRGRIGDQVFETKDWLPSCQFCNCALENDPDAMKKGLKKSKFHE